MILNFLELKEKSVVHGTQYLPDTYIDKVNSVLRNMCKCLHKLNYEPNIKPNDIGFAFQW